MNYYVYILESLKDGSLYKGYTTDYEKRLEEQNSGKSRYISKKDSLETGLCGELNRI